MYKLIILVWFFLYISMDIIFLDNIYAVWLIFYCIMCLLYNLYYCIMTFVCNFCIYSWVYSIVWILYYIYTIFLKQLLLVFCFCSKIFIDRACYKFYFLNCLNCLKIGPWDLCWFKETPLGMKFSNLGHDLLSQGMT